MSMDDRDFQSVYPPYSHLKCQYQIHHCCISVMLLNCTACQISASREIVMHNVRDRIYMREDLSTW